MLGTRPALYKKTHQERFEMNKIMFWPHLDTSKGVFGLHGAISAGDRRRRGGHGVTKVQMCDDVE